MGVIAGACGEATGALTGCVGESWAGLLVAGALVAGRLAALTQAGAKIRVRINMNRRLRQMLIRFDAQDAPV